MSIVRILVVMLFTCSPVNLCRAAEVELYLCIGAHKLEWTKRPPPPPDWRPEQAKFWIEAFFPEKGAATIIGAEPLPFLPSGVGRFFKADRERYSKRVDVKLGKASVVFEYYRLSPATLTGAERDRLVELFSLQDKLDDGDLKKRLWKLQ